MRSEVKLTNHTHPLLPMAQRCILTRSGPMTFFPVFKSYNQMKYNCYISFYRKLRRLDVKMLDKTWTS